MTTAKDKKDIFMKKTVAAVLCGLLVVVTGSPAFAGAGNVAYTVHNMSNNDPTGGAMTRYIQSDGENQICVFCHTPHNAQPNRPLWNKVMPTQAFNMYTSSVTLSSAARLATAPSAESLLCLSCHDGRTAINVLHNTTNPNAVPVGSNKVVDMGGDNTPYTIGDFSFGDGSLYGPNLGKIAGDPNYGGNLTNDHPISFSYKDARAEKPSQLSEVVDERIRFYGGAAKRIECGSCHDPHVNYGADRQGGTWTEGGAQPELKPFLRMGNAGSALCFACHNK
jgi:hypothetical protein